MYAVGSILSIERNMYRHVGAYVGNNRVLQNTPSNGEEIVSLRKFADSAPVAIIVPQQFCTRSFLDRAYAIALNPKRYDLLSNNCEHTISRALYGDSRSPQMLAAGVIAALVMLVLLANRGN